MATQPPEKKPLLVFTAHKGVFFGYGIESTDSVIELEKCQFCVYWSRAMHGPFGLASHGPDCECRIGPPVSRMTIRDVTQIAECTPEAAAKWEAQPWG